MVALYPQNLQELLEASAELISSETFKADNCES